MDGVLVFEKVTRDAKERALKAEQRKTWDRGGRGDDGMQLKTTLHQK